VVASIHVLPPASPARIARRLPSSEDCRQIAVSRQFSGNLPTVFGGRATTPRDAERRNSHSALAVQVLHSVHLIGERVHHPLS
jgi:hypothetical protein